MAKYLFRLLHPKVCTEPSRQLGRFVTFGRRDAAAERTGMYSRRVTKRPNCLEGVPNGWDRTTRLSGHSEHLFRWFAVSLLLVVTTVCAAPAPARQAELRDLLLQDCGSCHGMTLKGGLGPPLTPEALAGKSPELLRRTIVEGRPGTPMPPWGGLLSDADIDWLVKILLNGEATP